jgi:uncharacterized membrane protein
MLDLVFAHLCGRTVGHVWMTGGIELPCCQRCTGLYIGAFCAIALHLSFRLPPLSKYLWIPGLLLLQMVPFGFHLVSQGPLLRTLSGQLFAFGVVSFLWLMPGTCLWRKRKPCKSKTWAYVLIVGATLLILPAVALRGGALSGILLSWLCFAGLLSLGLLVLANVVLGLGMLASRRHFQE